MTCDSDLRILCLAYVAVGHDMPPAIALHMLTRHWVHAQTFATCLKSARSLPEFHALKAAGVSGSAARWRLSRTASIEISSSSDLDLMDLKRCRTTNHMTSHRLSPSVLLVYQAVAFYVYHKFNPIQGEGVYGAERKLHGGAATLRGTLAIFVESACDNRRPQILF